MKNIKLNITDPLKMDMDIEFNKLSLFLGQNGTGKTFILVNVWALTFIASGIIVAKVQNQPADVSALAQYVYDNSFSDQNISGIITGVFDENNEITITFEKGKVVSVTHIGLNKEEDITVVRYMSSNMRLFSSISMYLKIRRPYATLSQGEALVNMIKDFKLYDCMIIEKMITSMPMELSPRIKEGLKESFDIQDNIISFGVDLEKADFYACIDAPENKKYLSTYGNGHQSILNMTICNSL